MSNSHEWLSQTKECVYNTNAPYRRAPVAGLVGCLSSTRTWSTPHDSYEWVMALFKYTSWLPYEWVLSLIWVLHDSDTEVSSHVTGCLRLGLSGVLGVYLTSHINESWLSCSTHHGFHTNESCLSYEYDMTVIRKCKVTSHNALVMSLIWAWHD